MLKYPLPKVKIAEPHSDHLNVFHLATPYYLHPCISFTNKGGSFVTKSIFVNSLGI